MRKILISIIFAVILFFTPFSSSIGMEIMQKKQIKQYTIIPFKIQLSDEEVRQIDELCFKMRNDILIAQASTIIEQIISDYRVLDVNKFANILSENGINFFNRIETTNDPLYDLYNLIIELVIERLGWVNDVFEKTSDIISDTQRLWQDRTLPAEIRNELENIINKLSEIEGILTFLAEGKYLRFLREWSPFIIIQDLIAMVESITVIINDSGIIIRDIRNLINDLWDFIDWLNDEPWKAKIHVYGQVINGIFNDASNVTIHCLGETTETDENGNFSLYVNSTPSEDCIPPNEWYGIHKCIITAEKNDIIKNSIDTLSYVFSGGSFYWLFAIKDDDDSLFKINYNSYKIQWMKNYGPDQSGGRYQGMQPYGDCDNDGENELLIGGRDATLTVMKWDKDQQTYIETARIHSPFYNLFRIRELLTGSPPPCAGGFAIGDVTGDGENEIVVTWYGAVYKYIAGSYRIIGLNSWIFSNGGANGDCCIGDYDNDGENEIIMSGGAFSRTSPVPEIVVLKWNGWKLDKFAVYDDPAFGYAFMADVGDPDNDGENEIICGISSFEQSISPGKGNKVVVLDWDNKINDFIPTVIQETFGFEFMSFGGWCADSDMDGIDEIHVGYNSPRISIFDYHDNGYYDVFNAEWPGEDVMIEGINIGDVDDDGIPEVCAGTNIVHILQWNGSTYVEEFVIDETFGSLAVVNVGDFDNDGKNEINVAPVFVDEGLDYITWIFKYN